MLKNYFIIAYRNLMRHKVFSLINILGLALGMTASILILLWVQDELSYDKFHKNVDELYLVMRTEIYTGTDNFTLLANSGRLAPALEQQMPEIKHAFRVTWESEELFTFNDKAFKVKGLYADPVFFDALSFPLLHGSVGQVLQPKTVVISDSVAYKFFGTTDAVGQVFKINNLESYTVTGVAKSTPMNSSLRFDFVMPYIDYEARNKWLKNWGSNGILTFVQVEKGADEATLDAKLKNFLKEQDNLNSELFLHAYSKQHLYSDFKSGKSGSGRSAMYVRLFSVVAVLILLIACINFMNLATARAAKRAKEVGVRKAIGASKESLVAQFMVESILISFIALFVALNIAGMLMPWFNNVTRKAVELSLSDPQLVVLLAGVALFTGLVSGSYPAFFLSSFNPAVVLKGVVKLSGGVAFFRRGLVVFQFMLSALLIVCTLVVYLQLNFIRKSDIGLQREHVIRLPMEGDLVTRYETAKQQLLAMPGIAAVSGSNVNPLRVGNNTSNVTWKGKQEGADILIDFMNVDYDALETFGIQLKEGRDFSKSFGADTASFLINEEAVRLMQLQEPVGEWLELWGEKKGHIIGVVKDFQSNSMLREIRPLIINLDPEDLNAVFVKTEPGKTAEALHALETTFQKHNPAFPFEYHFLDADFEQMYKSEATIGELTNYFAGIAIFISCLGLFGLALFTAEQRKKEIGVRKVLGASVAGIVFMLSKDFLKLVLLANLIALPLGWYLMHTWLHDYVHRTHLSWWIFAIAFVATVLIAMFTLSFHAIRTAVANPVNSLRTE